MEANNSKATLQASLQLRFEDSESDIKEDPAALAAAFVSWTWQYECFASVRGTLQNAYCHCLQKTGGGQVSKVGCMMIGLHGLSGDL